jgi:hypothetical protein
MIAKERKENIKVLTDTIKYININLNTSIFLCQIDRELSKLIDGGYNERMLPNAINYIKSQMPSKTKNKDFYGTPYFSNGAKQRNPWWIYGPGEGTIGTNMEKIRFLKHLIQKLKK